MRAQTILLFWAASSPANLHPLWELAKHFALPISAAYLITLLAGIYFGLRTFESRARERDR
jgi:hypothetical protein